MIDLNKKWFALAFCCAISSCTKVDEYMLGADNTPKPTPLEKITPKMNLVENWSIPIGKTAKTSTFLKLKPVVHEKIMYTADVNGLIQAIDKTSAKILWTKQLKEGVISGPTVSKGFIAVGTSEANIIILKENNGQEVWRANLSSDALSKPVITHNKILAKSIDGNLYAFNLLTGEKLWVADHGAPGLMLKASSSPVIVGDLALVGFPDGKLDAVDLQTGAVVWQRSIAYPKGASDVERLVDIDADPIVQGDIAYLASYQGYIGALSLVNGQFLWRKPASTYKNLAIDSQTLYMTDSEDTVWALNKSDGHVKWKQISLNARGLTEPVLMGSRLIIGDKTGYLHVLSTHNGDVISRSQLSGAITISPAVSGKSVYVMTENGKLNRFSVS